MSTAEPKSNLPDRLLAKAPTTFAEASKDHDTGEYRLPNLASLIVGKGLGDYIDPDAPVIEAGTVPLIVVKKGKNQPLELLVLGHNLPKDHQWTPRKLSVDELRTHLPVGSIRYFHNSHEFMHRDDAESAEQAS